MKRQYFLDRLPDVFRDPKLGCLDRLSLTSLQGQPGADVEELLEDQAHLGGSSKPGKVFKGLVSVREMRLTESARTIHQIVLPTHRLGQALRDLPVKRGEGPPDQLAQDARSERAHRLVDRHDPAYLQ